LKESLLGKRLKDRFDDTQDPKGESALVRKGALKEAWESNLEGEQEQRLS
jgi:hypothetical protein